MTPLSGGVGKMQKTHFHFSPHARTGYPLLRAMKQDKYKYPPLIDYYYTCDTLLRQVYVLDKNISVLLSITISTKDFNGNTEYIYMHTNNSILN
jgi:hypothetical protein